MKYKVFFCIPSLAGGGAEKVFVNLVNHLDPSVFEVTLINLTSSNSKYVVSDEVRVLNLNAKRVRNALFKIIMLVNKEKPDLIISTLGHLNFMLLLLKGFFPRKTKLVIRPTNILSLNKKESKFKQLRRYSRSIFYKLADKVICQSELMKNDFIKYTGVSPSKVTKIFNPVDINKTIENSNEAIDYSFDQNYKYIIFVGRLEEVKRIPLIIESFEEYHYKNLKSKLLILGEGSREQELKDLVIKKDLQGKVVFLGFQKNPYKWIRNSDLFIMASKSEGMPNVLIEALTLEIPVLILRHPGGTIDILKKLNIQNRFVNELKITSNSFDSYNKNLLPLLSREFGIEKIISDYEKIFINICKDTK